MILPCLLYTSDILDLSKIEAGTLDFTMDHLDIKSFCEDIMRNYDIKEDKPVQMCIRDRVIHYCFGPSVSAVSISSMVYCSIYTTKERDHK